MVLHGELADARRVDAGCRRVRVGKLQKLGPEQLFHMPELHGNFQLCNANFRVTFPCGLWEYPCMTDRSDQLRAKLLDAMRAADVNANVLARKISRRPDYIRDFLSGRKNSLGAFEVSNIEEALNLPLGTLSGRNSILDKLSRKIERKTDDQWNLITKEMLERAQNSINFDEASGRPPVSAEFYGQRDLPIFSTVENGNSSMLVSKEPIDFVPRPWFLREVRNGYAIVIAGDSMVPAYEPGDSVIINPRLPAIKDRNALFIKDESDDQFTAKVARLSRMTEADWHIQVWNPAAGSPAQSTLSRVEWSYVYKIINKHKNN